MNDDFEGQNLDLVLVLALQVNFSQDRQLVSFVHLQLAMSFLKQHFHSQAVEDFHCHNVTVCTSVNFQHNLV